MLSERIRSARQFALFAEVTPAELEIVIGAAREKRFDRRETIFTEGDPVRHVTMVLSGIVKVTQMGLNGNEVILRLNAAGEIVGLLSRLRQLHSLRNGASRSAIRGSGMGCGSV